MYAFLVVLGILVVGFLIMNVSAKESFVGEVPLNTKTNPFISSEKMPVPTSLPAASNPVPSDLPGPLPTAPYQQIGANLPSPYKDPSLVKTTRQRILNALELVKGFLAFQATEIEDNSDPSIQLPLQTARADFKRLESEANVLQRNPGLTPQMTVLDIAQIEDNLAYLQKEVELIGANRPFQSNRHDADLEGFTGTAAKEGKVATEAELMAFSSRIQQAIIDLSSSGTTDPIVQTRVGNLTGMKASIDAIIQKLDTGAMQPADVPVKAQDIENALPLLVATSQPLPDVIQQISDGEYGDPNNLVGTITSFLKSAQDMLSTSNFSFSVNYAQPTVPATMGASTLTDTGFPSPYDIHQVSSAPSLNNILSSDSVSDMWAMDPRAEGRSEMVGSFDWKKRAYDIVDQVKKRELNPADYGIMDSEAKVSSGFSWKGYTKMICTRLQASSTFNLDELCGCPSAGWKGW
jgi:hypothetical protein